MKKLFILLPIFLFSCSSSTEEKPARPEDWRGQWAAKWETPPESYPGVDDMDFTMNGNFLFTKDSLTVTAMGYPSCIFNVDTLSHTQTWYVSNDSLFLVNEPGSIGMTYKVLSKTSDKIQLQLMQDIFITLQK